MWLVVKGYKAMDVLVPPLFFLMLILGYSFSFFVGVHWAINIYHDIVMNQPSKSMSFIQSFLESIEILLLSPVPAIISTVVYNNLTRIFTDASETAKKRSGSPESRAAEAIDPETPTARGEGGETVEASMTLAKRLLIGIIVTVAATRMLYELLTEKPGELQMKVFYGGATLIVALAIFAGVGLRVARR